MNDSCITLSIRYPVQMFLHLYPINHWPVEFTCMAMRYLPGAHMQGPSWGLPRKSPRQKDKTSGGPDPPPKSSRKRKITEARPTSPPSPSSASPSRSSASGDNDGEASVTSSGESEAREEDVSGEHVDLPQTAAKKAPKKKTVRMLT
jgi:hypothetical protein